MDPDRTLQHRTGLQQILRCFGEQQKGICMFDDYIVAIGIALSSPTRVRLLQVASAERVPVGMLAERLGVTRATIHHHLAVLVAASIVEVEQVGRRRYPRLLVGPWEGLLRRPGDPLRFCG